MKTKLSLFFGVLIFIVAFESCDKDGNEPNMSYTVTFNADGGTPTPQSQTVKAGEKATAPATPPAKQGYVFLYWYLSGTTTAYSFQNPVNSDITLYAKWQEEAAAEYWQVNWNLNGGAWTSGDNHATQVLKGGTLAEPTAPTKSGDTFEGWYKESTLTNKVTFPYDVSNITSSITLYAKWKTEGSGETPPTTLYIAGEDNFGACCWRVDLTTKEITKISLNPYGQANGIVVYGGDVYISGYQTNGYKYQACYWKNGNITYLSKASDDLKGNAIAISGNDIYVAGEDYTNNKNKACYWKNGEIIYLPSSLEEHAYPTDIFISNNNVYLSGVEGGTKACYWKNGIKTSLSNYRTLGNAIFISGTDVYVAGNQTYPLKASYWKNNTLIVLTDGVYDAWAHDIIVSGGKVYVGGGENTSNYSVNSETNACIWINGEKTILETTRFADVESIGVSGNNIYAAGNYGIGISNATKYIACCWINGVKLNLTDGTKSAKALAIALSWE